MAADVDGPAGENTVGFGAIYAAKRLARRLKERMSKAAAMRQSLREQVQRDKATRGRTNVVKEGHALQMLKAQDAEDASRRAEDGGNDAGDEDDARRNVAAAIADD